MSTYFKGNFHASPLMGFAELKNRHCDLDFLTPSEYDEYLTDMLWPRSQGFLAMPFDSSTGLWDIEAAWWMWPRRDSGSRSCKLLSGITKNSTGTPLPNCVVKSYTSADDVERESCMSDNAGNFDCPTYAAGSHYLVAYKAGNPDVAGTTRNDLTSS